MNTAQRQRLAERLAPKCEPYCLFCRCTDSSPCTLGCAWIFRSRTNNWGVCTACEPQLGELIRNLGHWLIRRGLAL